MRTYMFINFVTFYISIPFMLKRAGYNFALSFIPILNLYFLSKALKTNIIITIAIVLGIIFSPIRNLIITTLYFYLPFVFAYYFNIDFKMAAISLVLPFLGYPYIALRGSYNDFVL